MNEYSHADDDAKSDRKDGENFFKKITKRKKEKKDNFSQASSSDLNKPDGGKDLEHVEKINKEEEEHVEARPSFQEIPENQ